jgi:hypothetical protein
MLADCWPRRATGGGERGDVRLALAEGVQQGQPGAVGKEPEELGGSGELLVARALRVRVMCT